MGRDLEEQSVIHDKRITRPRQPFARVSVVIPTLNEADNLPYVFARLPMDHVFEVIVVDGHSTDDTIAIARSLYPAVRVVLQDGEGKGNALACGFTAARGDVIVMLDADGSTDPAEIPTFLTHLFDGADFAKGSRFIHGGGSSDITALRRLGNRFLGGVVNRLYGTRYTDLCYGYNAFWFDVLPAINVNCAGFEVETLINVRIAKARLVVSEVASHEHQRLHGVSKLSPFRDGLRMLRIIVTERYFSPSNQGWGSPAVGHLKTDAFPLRESPGACRETKADLPARHALWTL